MEEEEELNDDEQPMTSFDVQALFQSFPKEKKTKCNKILKNLSKDKKSRWELKHMQEQAFKKMLKRLNKVEETSSFKILRKFFNEEKGGGLGYHKKFMESIDRANWRIDIYFQEEEEYENMIENEIRRICEKD